MRVDLSEHARIQIIYTEEVGQRMGGNGAFIRRPSNVASEVMARLYEGIGAEDGRERSICTVRSEKTL